MNNNLSNKKGTFFAVAAITLLLAYVAFFGVNFGSVNLMSVNDMRFGIDINGGVDAAFKPKDLDHVPTDSELEAARAIIEVRLDQHNILDRDVTIDKDSGMILVQFPWKSGSDLDPQKAIQELGDMARLTFRDPDGTIVMEGVNVASAAAGYNQTLALEGGGNIVTLTLKPEGQQMFADATGRLVGQRISIYLDEELLSSPTVKSRIDSDTCEITGMENREAAVKLANQINSGALPFALETDNYSIISATLGADALEVMVISGLIAFLMICVALTLYYRTSGLIASISLLLQITGQILLLTWPQFTITLPGIAGIILSIGMGVDANVIVSERIREEIRSGKSTGPAVIAGIKAAFSSIFDGNITVLIVAFIMLIFGSGAILSFAYTLLFGIIMNFVGGVTATRLMTNSIVRFKFFQKPSRFLTKRSLQKTDVKIIPFYKRRRVFLMISSGVILLGLVMTFVNGINVDIKFRGGAVVRYAMSNDIELDMDSVVDLVSEKLPGRVVNAQQTINNLTDDLNEKTRLVLSVSGGQEMTEEELRSVLESLMEKFPEQGFEQKEVNNVSPFFSAKFFERAILSLVLSAFLIILYVGFSFRKIHGLSAGVMALLALLHDVIIVFFTFVIFNIPIGDSFVAVALTILGYSINNTIIIYDRIRENSKISRNLPIEDIVDKSISQSLTRSLNTSLAVFLSVSIVFVFAAISSMESITSFALPMAIGTVAGCYSSVCIAGPIWTAWQKRTRAGADKAKKGAR